MASIFFQKNKINVRFWSTISPFLNYFFFFFFFFRKASLMKFPESARASVQVDNCLLKTSDTLPTLSLPERFSSFTDFVKLPFTLSWSKRLFGILSSVILIFSLLSLWRHLARYKLYNERDGYIQKNLIFSTNPFISSKQTESPWLGRKVTLHILGLGLLSTLCFVIVFYKPRVAVLQTLLFLKNYLAPWWFF